MAKKGENIFLRKDGRWEARYVKDYSEDNKIIYGFVYGKSYSEVKKKRNKLVINLDINSIKNARKKDNSFNHVIDSWLLQKKLTLKETSYSRYFELINKHIRPQFGNNDVNKIDNDMVSKFILKKINENLSPKTIKDILMILKQIAKHGNINITVNGPKVLKKPINILTELEQKKLEKYIQNNFDNMELGIFIALYMGLRIGEVCALKWSDIDFEKEVISIKRTISRVKDFDNSFDKKTKIIFTEPKTDKSKRIIPIPKSILVFLKAIRSKCESSDYYVLTNNAKFIEPRSYYNHYKRILKKIELGGFNFHALRHTFATRCIELGFDPKTLMEILGHSDIKITLAFYVHPTNNLKIESMNKLKLLEV